MAVLLVLMTWPAAALAESADRGGAAPGQDQSALAAAQQTTWVAQGAGDRVLYIFIDPNCPYCSMLYRNLRPLIGPHGVQVRWIPVAILDPTSLGKAAAILEAQDPLAALDYNEENYDVQAHAGGIREEVPSAQTESSLRANAEALERVGIPLVPTMVFRDSSGAVRTLTGALSPIALQKMLRRIGEAR